METEAIPSRELSALLSTLHDAAVAVGDDYRIVAANPACTDLFGGGHRLVGRPCHQAFHGLREPCRGRREPGSIEARPIEDCPLERCRGTGEPCRGVHLHRTAHGEEHQDVVLYPVSDHGETAALFVGVLRPVLVASAQPSAELLTGRSAAFRRILELILRVAPRETPVLLLGETGTGRGHMARAIHRLSRRAAGAFLPVACSGLDAPHLAAELTRAPAEARRLSSHPGDSLDPPRGGTIFFEDVDELPADSQGELLRWLKTSAERPVGGPAAESAEFRTFFSSQPDLRRKVEEGGFSSTLYYRIDTFPIELPPLRQRPEDLALLAASVLCRIGYPQLAIDPRTLVVLRRHPLPGNLHELRRILEHASLSCTGGVILPEHLPEEVGAISSLS